ncbi:hypothetical protein GS399_09795 [Pedobacter sp. HMF7647]|uniref:Uncharacterized protein n=1 Tax=Hufsiella arboris TaxID=2695275 RepID=A0A7K1YA19_9SPHI|nr:hypothetical protein [Hufsiella arboris]MXV51260.1 hypothetical protein [Hufsiella arboris]
MKTLKNIAAGLLIIASTGAFANEKAPSKTVASLKNVSAAPFTLGSPDESAPENLKAMTVKVAPMIYGNQSETVPSELIDLKRVPVAPMVYGCAEESAPENLKAMTVKVAPMVYGDPSAAAPVIE